MIIYYYPIGNYIWIYLFDMAMMEALAIYTWQFRKLPGAMYYIARQACKGAWILFLLLSEISAFLSVRWVFLNVGLRRRQALWFVMPALGEFYRNPSLKRVEVMREYPEGCRYYRLNRIPVKRVGDHLPRKVILVTDITRQKQEEAKRIGQEKAQSILNERNRLGRELHDGAGQFPGYVKIQTQTIQMLLQKGQLLEAMEQLKTLSQAADAAFSNVREAINSLKGDVGEWNFISKLQDWLEQFRKMTGITIVSTGLEGMSSSRIMPEAKVQLLRIIQEILANARKHSGAHSIKMAFICHADRLVVTIADDGCGFDVKKMQSVSGKFGLHIIMERAGEMGGTCRVQSVLGHGTVVTIEIPFLPIT